MRDKVETLIGVNQRGQGGTDARNTGEGGRHQGGGRRRRTADFAAVKMEKMPMTVQRVPGATRSVSELQRRRRKA